MYPNTLILCCKCGATSCFSLLTWIPVHSAKDPSRGYQHNEQLLNIEMPRWRRRWKCFHQNTLFTVFTGHLASTIQRLQIHTEGGRALARALRSNVALCRLNIRLNRLGDEGGRAILDVTRSHPRLDSLDLAHNGLGVLSARALCKCLVNNSTLLELDVSGNELPGDSGAAIREALETNQSLQVRERHVCMHMHVHNGETCTQVVSQHVLAALFSLLVCVRVVTVVFGLQLQLSICAMFNSASCRRKLENVPCPRTSCGMPKVR
jgi:Leucine Rich repeat